MDRPRAAALTLCWGLFLASSWTWCIGMFLPVPLLRNFGWAGFLAFAVPNVVGCAAFGYVLSPEASRRFVERHPLLLRAFSVVTIAYHCFFATFVATRLLPPAERAAPGTALLIAGALLACAGALSLVPRRAWPWLGACAFGISLACFATLGPAGLDSFRFFGDRPPAELPWLVPTLVFGFLLCPYLDLTFHRALRESPSRHAFAIFGVMFAAMLVFTAAYAPLVAQGLPAIVLAHLAVQGIFTVAAHLGALRALDARSDRERNATRLAIGACAVAAAIVGVAAANGEATYLRFLVFYGLVFPACVALLCTRRTPAPAGRRWLLAGIVVASLPLYELGFIDFRTWLLPWPALACVVAAAWPRPALRNNGSPRRGAGSGS